MLNPKPTTFDSSRLLTRWNLAIGEALTQRDKTTLRTLAKMIATTAEALTGAEKARAVALVARAEAGLRYLRTLQSWRAERRLCHRAAGRVLP